MALNETLRTHISELVASSRVVLFMKGTRQMPQCGFSAKVVQILEGLGTTYETIDVLRSPEIREGIKEFSQWPTIPQLYVDGQLVGGCDIVGEMDASGELRKIVGATEPSGRREPGVHVDRSERTESSVRKIPEITMTDAAAKAFQTALADAGEHLVRLQVDAEFRHELFIAPRAPGDVEVAINGLALLLDEPSARRAGGIRIDFVAGDGGGFKITNPNEPPRVKPLAPRELKAMLDRGDKIELFDVRTPQERQIATIDGAHHLDDAGEKHLATLDRNVTVVFHCHHGVRSRAAAEHALQQGFTNVYNLEGGIDVWSQTVDPKVPRY